MKKKTKAFISALLCSAITLAACGCAGGAGTSSGGASDTSDSTGADTSSDISENSSDTGSSGETSGSGNDYVSGSTYGQVAMGGGGFVSGVFATKEDGLFYARTDVGGAYRYDKTLGRWKSLNYDISEEDRGLLGIDGLAFAENEPNKLYLFAGTEYFSDGLTCLLYSEDYGETFRRTDLTELVKAHGNGMGRGNGERIAVDPKNSDIIYIGGRTGGVIKSTDGGLTFTALDLGTNTITKNAVGVNCLLIDPASGDDNSCSTVYATISRTGEENMYCTKDGGATWAPVENAPKGIMPQRMKMRSDGKILITYADTEGPWNNSRSKGSIRLFDPQKGTFDDISPAEHMPFGDVVSDPANPDRMAACSENIYIPQPNGAYGDRFYVTVDGGKSWTFLNDVMTMSDGGIEWVNSSSMHWCSSMCIDPNNTDRVMVVSGNGIFACDNIWDASPEFYFNARGIEETVPFELVSIKGGKLVTVIGDYDGFAQDDAFEYGTHHNSSAGSMKGLAVAGKAPDVWVKCGGDSETHGFWYTEDAGATWINVTKSPIKKELGKIAFGGSVAVSADGKTFYWAPENGMGVYYTTDKGENWEKSEGALGTKRLACDPVNPDYVYASSDGAFYYSADGGKTFKQNNALAVFSASRPITAPDNEGKIYYCAMGLQVSEDHGETFKRMDSVAVCITAGLGKGKSDKDPYSIFIWGKPTNDDELGIYMSDDDGASWRRINDSKHEFGGPGNGGFIYGDFNVYGRCYMSTVGLGIAVIDAGQAQ